MKVIDKPKLPIKRPGIYSGIHIDDYHGPNCTDGYSVSSTNLRKVDQKSLKHMYVPWAHNPNRTERPMTDAMRVGRMCHHLFLGEPHFAIEYIAHPATYRDKKTAEEKPWHMGADACKRWVADRKAEGKIVVKPAEVAAIRPMVASIKADPLTQADGLYGLTEHSMIVKDKETGLWLKSRPDIIPNDGDFVDLKITTDVTDVGVYRMLRDYGYHMQAGLTWEACEQLDIPFQTFTLFLIESGEPYCTRAVPLYDEDISRGRQQCRRAMRKIANAIDKGYWPGPGEGEMRAMGVPAATRLAIDAQLGETE